MTFYMVSALVNVATSVVLGILVLLADRRAVLNRIFALFAASIVFWSYAYFMWQIAPDADSALLWTHLLMAGAVFITPVYFDFVVRFLGTGSARSVHLGYFGAAVFSALNWTPSFINGVAPIDGFPFWPQAGVLFAPFLVWWIFYAVYPVVLLLRAHASGLVDKTAIHYLLAGTIIGYAGGCTNYFLWYGIPVLPVGNISASIYIAIVAYVTMRNKLFNMKVIATELLIFSLWLFIFARLLLAASVSDQLADGALLLVTLGVGVLLIRSVDREVEQRVKIQLQEQELEVANRQQESLLHFISHEIKGYLTKNEAAFAGIASGDFGETSDALKRLSESALDDTRKGVDTVMDILDASNLKKGTVSFNKKKFDFCATMGQMFEEMKNSAEEKGLAFSFTCPPEPAYIDGDEDKVRRHIVRNLLDNSIRYTPSGSVAVSVERGEGVVRLVVVDTGVGITAEDMAHLFTEGGHGTDSIKINVHSTGYGLFIAKQIAEAHGGKVWAESEGTGKGSRFVVEFPLSS